MSELKFDPETVLEVTKLVARHVRGRRQPVTGDNVAEALAQLYRQTADSILAVVYGLEDTQPISAAVVP